MSFMYNFLTSESMFLGIFTGWSCVERLLRPHVGYVAQDGTGRRVRRVSRVRHVRHVRNVRRVRRVRHVRSGRRGRRWRRERRGRSRSDRGQQRARRARHPPHAAAPCLPHHILVSLHTRTRHTLSITLLNFPTLRARCFIRFTMSRAARTRTPLPWKRKLLDRKFLILVMHSARRQSYSTTRGV